MTIAPFNCAPSAAISSGGFPPTCTRAATTSPVVERDHQRGWWREEGGVDWGRGGWPIFPLFSLPPPPKRAGFGRGAIFVRPPYLEAADAGLRLCRTGQHRAPMTVEAGCRSPQCEM